MNLGKILPFFIACSCISSVAAQGTLPVQPNTALPTMVVSHSEFRDTVIPITEVKIGLGIGADFGTGFCLDPACRFIGTNYHVAAIARPRKIGGQEVIQRYLATGPDDEGATMNAAISASVGQSKYTLARDLAIFELRHGLPHHHGVGFSLTDLQVGQEVDIYAYPMSAISPIRSLVRFQGTYRAETTTGLLAFAYTFSGGKEIRPGASGGIVVDRKTEQIVGVLTGIMTNGDAVALAVPIQSLADFVRGVQPSLAQTIFPSTNGTSSISADFYPRFVPPAREKLERRPEEPPEVGILRMKAQDLADSMRNFVAVQTYAWGSQDSEPYAGANYEVQVLNSSQRFREYPYGKKVLADVYFPSIDTSLRPSSEWSDLPKMVGTQLGLKIQQAPDVVVNGRHMKVFQYAADVEDRMCGFMTVVDNLFFKVKKEHFVSCYGEVWTDQDTNILRMSEHYDLLANWKAYEAVVTYGWIERADGPPHLVPLTINTRAEFKKKTYWCRGQFIDYRVFGSQAQIVRK